MIFVRTSQLFFRIYSEFIYEYTNISLGDIQIGSKRCHDLSEESCIIPQLGSGPGVSGSGSGHYTVDDYGEILMFAENRHITVIPEFDCPGHSHASVKCIRVGKNPGNINITRPTRAIMGNMDKYGF